MPLEAAKFVRSSRYRYGTVAEFALVLRSLARLPGAAPGEAWQPELARQQRQTLSYVGRLGLLIRFGKWWFDHVKIRRTIVAIVALAIIVPGVISWIANHPAFLTYTIASTWSVAPGPPDSDQLWIWNGSTIYPARLGSARSVAQQTITTDRSIQAIACVDPNADCYVMGDIHQIGVLHGREVSWQTLPKNLMLADFASFWVARGARTPARIFAVSRGKLYASADNGASWQEVNDFHGAFVTQLDPIDSQHALLTVTTGRSRAFSNTRRVFHYATDDGGATWRPASADSAPVGWKVYSVTTTANIDSSVELISGTLDLKVLAAPDRSIYFGYFGESSYTNDTVWRSTIGQDWQASLTVDARPGSVGCGATYSQIAATGDLSHPLIYRSYAFLNGEQGVFVSANLGKDWSQVVIVEAQPQWWSIFDQFSVCRANADQPQGN